MKILISTGIYPPEIGGPATYSKLLFDQLPKYGFSVSVLSFGEVRKFPKIIRHIMFLFKLIFKAYNADIIFAQDTVSVGLPSLFAAKILGKKFFVRVPGDYAWEQSTQRFSVKDGIDEFQNKEYSFRVEFLRKLQKITVNGANRVITPSNYFKELVSRWLKEPEKVSCIYNGIDLSFLSDNSNKIQSKTLISAGRLVPWKGFKNLIHILKSLPDWKLSIAGDGPERKELEAFAKNEGVINRVNFLGQIKRENLISLLKSSDIFILNTSFESFSFQVVEAMASGIPVITTNIGNLSEIIDNNKNGILIEPNNENQMIDAINKLSSDINFRDNIIKEAKLRSTIFSIENTIKNLIELINKENV